MIKDHLHTHSTWITLSQFLFMSILTKSLFSFVGGHFMAFSFFTARHFKLI